MAILDFEVRKDEAYADGQSFGERGSFRRLDGLLTYAFDPDHELNAGIVDLGLCPRDADGCVRARALATIVLPEDPAQSNGCLILDVPNRGNSIAARTLNRAGAAAMRDAFAPGDGFLFRHGFSLVSVGWQSDVDPLPGALTIELPVAGSADAPVRGQVQVELRPLEHSTKTPLSSLMNVPYDPADPDEAAARLIMREYDGGADHLIDRSRWRFAARRAADVAPRRVLELDDGFEPGRIYLLTYTAERPKVSGAGLLALRDAAAFFRLGENGALPLSFDRVLGFGVSQTGRVLRQMLRLGLTVAESSAVALDGLLIHIAGGIGGEFNHRFALPSQITAPSFGHLPPFAYGMDPASGEPGLLAAPRARGHAPKVVATNTSWEYWRGDGALVHLQADGNADLPTDPDVRTYLFAGSQHGGGMLPQTMEMPLTGISARYGVNVLDVTPLLRAALINLDRWVSDGVEPPPSRHPRLDDGSAVPRDALLPRFAALPEIEPIDSHRLQTVPALDLGPQATQGIGQYPARRGPAYPAFVSDVDADLNERAGVRLPDISVPVGTHTGWNAQDPQRGDPRNAPMFLGFTRFFAASRDERDPADPRPSLAERYAGRQDYLARVREAANQLAQAGYLLVQDIELVVENCAARYDEAIRVGPRNPPPSAEA